LKRKLTGTRIRDKRMERGMRQVDLAARVGISGTYLSLIERNRRNIGGTLLHNIARELGVEPAGLSEGAEGALLDRLRIAAQQLPDQKVDIARLEDFVGGFPGWAALVAEQFRRITFLEARVSELADRMTHDPHLASSLYQVISAVTSIRSAAAILVGPEVLEGDWQARFQANIHEDSIKLAESSKTLVKFLEEPGDHGGIMRTPQEEMHQFLDDRAHHIVELEGPTDAGSVARILSAGAGAVSGAARELLAAWLERYRADAAAMPLAPFQSAARDCRYNPTILAKRYQRNLASVLRRLAALPPGAGHPPIGLAVCDGAGVLTYLKRTADFTLPNPGFACSLWPLFQVLGRPSLPMRALVTPPGASVANFLCYAVAEPLGPTGFDEVPIPEATMLVLPDPHDTRLEARPVGTSCRVCPRGKCPARREPTINSSFSATDS
jgi:XRE family transcriptional regulator, fatty acid utilization regulator